MVIFYSRWWPSTQVSLPFLSQNYKSHGFVISLLMRVGLSIIQSLINIKNLIKFQNFNGYSEHLWIRKECRKSPSSIKNMHPLHDKFREAQSSRLASKRMGVKSKVTDFPGGPVVKTLNFQCTSDAGEANSISGELGSHMSHVLAKKKRKGRQKSGGN